MLLACNRYITLGDYETFHRVAYCVTRNETLHRVWLNRQEAESDISPGLLMAAIVSGLASIVIGQVGGAWPRWANISGENSAPNVEIIF